MASRALIRARSEAKAELGGTRSLNQPWLCRYQEPRGLLNFSHLGGVL